MIEVETRDCFDVFIHVLPGLYLNEPIFGTLSSLMSWQIILNPLDAPEEAMKCTAKVVFEPTTQRL